jgi:hypothetical protein
MKKWLLKKNIVMVYLLMYLSGKNCSACLDMVKQRKKDMEISRHSKPQKDVKMLILSCSHCAQSISETATSKIEVPGALKILAQGWTDAKQFEILTIFAFRVIGL